ncbi:MAG: hypothetical protein PVG32_07805 [Anaerolineales bacterium]|jgi:hypothetical protein
MAKKSIAVTENPIIIVDEIRGDLQVKGWDRSELVAKIGEEDDLVLVEGEEAIHLDCADDCILLLPHGASLQVRTILGDGAFKALEGELEVQEVAGDLVLRDVSTTHLSTVSSDLSARRLRGDLEVNNVGGNAVIRDVDGQFSGDAIGGHLHLRDISGGVSAKVGGNTTLELAPVPWQAYTVRAGGNIRCQLPSDSNAEFHITSGAQKIRIKLGDISDTITEGTHELTLGHGGPTVTLSAGGKVDLGGFTTAWDISDEIDVDFGGELSGMADELAERISHQIEAQMEMLENHLDTQFAPLSASLSGAGLSEEQAERIRQRMEQARERAAARAEAAAHRAQEKLQRKLAAAKRKAERKARAATVRRARRERQKRGESITGFTSSPRSISEPVSDDERLLILKMLQEKQISLNEAEKLLAALEGKED